MLEQQIKMGEPTIRPLFQIIYHRPTNFDVLLCTEKSADNGTIYDVYIHKNMLFTHTLCGITRFVRSGDGSYKVFTKVFREGNDPILKIKKYEDEIEIILSNSYHLIHKGEEMNRILKEVEYAYQNFKKMNQNEMK